MSGLDPLRFGQVELGEGRVAVLSAVVGVSLEIRVSDPDPDEEDGWRETGERLLLPLEVVRELADMIWRAMLAPEALLAAFSPNLRGRA